MPNNALEKMESAFKAEFSECKTVKIYSGPFTAKEILTFASEPPVVLIACMGISQSPPYNGDRAGIMRMDAFVLTTPDCGEQGDCVGKDALALNMVGRILIMLDEKQSWPLENPDRIEAKNMTADCSDTNAALWSVSWKQPIQLSDTSFVEIYEGAELKSIFLGHSPRVGEAHKDDYIEINKGTE